MTVAGLIDKIRGMRVINWCDKPHVVSCLEECVAMGYVHENDSITDLAVCLENRRKAGIAYQSKCTRTAAAHEKKGENAEALYWEQQKDRAWLKTVYLKNAIGIVKDELQRT